MRYSLFLILLIFSFFPACKRINEHTQRKPVVAKHQIEQTKALPGETCELVDRSKLHKGVACLVGAPTVLGAGAGLSYSVLIGPGCCVPGAAAFFAAAGIAGLSVVAAVFLLCKGGSYLCQHARANKERERRRKEERESMRKERILADNGASL